MTDTRPLFTRLDKGVGAWAVVNHRRRAVRAAKFDLICWRKGDFQPLVDSEFTQQRFTDADTGAEHTYTLAETTTEL